MPITRCSEQKRKTLIEFYSDIYRKDKILPERGKAMLAIIDMINECFQQTMIYGLTSHDTLTLLQENNSMSDWYVAISALGSSKYHFEYRMTKEKSPWEFASVRGQANSIEEAKKYLLISMRESSGWQGNTELEKLIEEMGL